MLKKFAKVFEVRDGQALFFVSLDEETKSNKDEYALHQVVMTDDCGVDMIVHHLAEKAAYERLEAVTQNDADLYVKSIEILLGVS